MTKKEKFITQSIEKFGDKFDYSKVTDINNKEIDKITIICPIHGEFETTPKSFLISKYGCKKCANQQKGKHYRTDKNNLSSVDTHIPHIENPIISKSLVVGTVYCFINSINGKKYIGETVKKDYTVRFNEHRSKSERGVVTYFYNAIRKYGWDAFNKYIIYQTEPYEDTEENRKKLNDIVNKKEIEFINKYNTTNPNFGYNLTKGGDEVLGYHFSKETKEKMSKSHQGEKHWNYGKRNEGKSRAILQFDLDGNYIAEFPSMAEITRQLGYKANNVCRCCDNLIGSYMGYIWVRKDDYYEGYIQKYKSRVKCKSNDKEVLQYTFLGDYVASYISCAEAKRILKMGYSPSGAASGTDFSAGGYIWIYKKDFTEDLLKEKLELVKSSRNYKKIVSNLRQAALINRN